MFSGLSKLFGITSPASNEAQQTSSQSFTQPPTHSAGQQTPTVNPESARTQMANLAKPETLFSTPAKNEEAILQELQVKLGELSPALAFKFLLRSLNPFLGLLADILNQSFSESALQTPVPIASNPQQVLTQTPVPTASNPSSAAERPAQTEDSQQGLKELLSLFGGMLQPTSSTTQNSSPSQSADASPKSNPEAELVQLLNQISSQQPQVSLASQNANKPAPAQAPTLAA